MPEQLVAPECDGRTAEPSRSRGTLRTIVVVLVASMAAVLPGPAQSQVVDALDSYPPRWSLAKSDCGAEVFEHSNQATGGIGDSGCESVTLKCGHGTEALLEYRIEPAQIIDELTAVAWIKSTKPGQRIGLRVRFPFLTDPTTRQSVAVVIFGADYRDVGQWQKLGVGAITSQVRLKAIALRREYGTTANVDEPYVDAVVLNMYTGPGIAQVALDNISVDGMVPVSTTNLFSRSQTATRLPTTGEPAASNAAPASTYLPARKITRVLQHNGEPLDWVRTLGFDAVLIGQPPNERMLREAMTARIQLWAPPPSAPDIALEPLLEPLSAYYLGTSLSESALENTAATSRRVRAFPTRWQRPVVLAPAESFRNYAALSDAVVQDLPAPLRGLAADEEVAYLQDRQTRQGRVLSQVIGVQTDTPKPLIQQLDAISSSIGVPRGDELSWHALYLQVARSLQTAPQAVLFRSNRSLTSGLPEDQRRSIALSYINRYLESIGPLVAGSTSSDTLRCEGSRYRCSQLQFPGGQLLIASSYAQHRNLALAGDGDAVRISLPPSDAVKLAWRITHYAAERLEIQTTSRGPALEIVSPDTVETIVIASDPETGGRLANGLRRLAGQAALDRWQLTRDALEQLRFDWQAATGSRTVNASRPSIDLLNAASNTLRDAEPLVRAGDASAALRMARRADAWQLKSRWNLHAALSEGGQLLGTTSCPPLLSTGGVGIQLLWAPLMKDQGWSTNRLTGGSLDDIAGLNASGWSFGRRAENLAKADVVIEAGRQVEGAGCLLATISALTPEPIPGGYAGTTIQLRSPSMRFDPGTAIRLDAKIRTLGFGGPDQGVLVYDTMCGPELGVLVRATPQWQTVRLYRQTLTDAEVHLVFEAIGAGEVLVDDVQVRSWEPKPVSAPALRRIAERPD